MTDRLPGVSWLLSLVACLFCAPPYCHAEKEEMPVGDATVWVVDSNGDPWPTGTVRISGCGGQDSIPVRYGLVQLHDVPAGPVHVEIDKDGYAIRSLQGEIVAGEAVYLGELKALTLEEGTGIVVGRVAWAGRGRAPRMSLNNRSPYDRTEGFYCIIEDTSIEVDEPFELRLDPGRHELVVFLDMPFLRDRETIGLDLRGIKTFVDVVAGQEAPVEIIVPPLTGEVVFQGEIRRATFAMPFDETTTFLQMGGVEQSGPGQFELSHLPHGLAQIEVERPLPDSLFRESRGMREVWESHWVEITSEPALVELPDLRVGCLEITSHRADDMAEPPYCIEAIPLFDALPENVRAVRRPEQIRGATSYARGDVYTLFLAPGRYIIEFETERNVTDDTLTREIEIRDGETVKLEI